MCGLHNNVCVQARAPPCAPCAQAVAELGDKWRQVATRVGTRTGQQCRERYQNVLRPGLKSGVSMCACVHVHRGGSSHASRCCMARAGASFRQQHASRCGCTLLPPLLTPPAPSAARVPPPQLFSPEEIDALKAAVEHVKAQHGRLIWTKVGVGRVHA